MRPVFSIAAAVGITVLALLAPTQSAAAPDLESAVTSAVSEKLLANRMSAQDTRRPVVTINRQADGWAFGTAVLAGTPGKDEIPHGWLFLARHSDDGWQLAFDGEAGFPELAAAAPMTTTRERELFASHGEATPTGGGDFRTGMRLPWSTGVGWVMSGGPHGWSGYDSPYSSLDLHGGDQVVRATRGGTAYTMCRGWVRVIHDRGYSTDYYHLWSNINVNGAAVGAGAYLGYTGTDVTCGGAASGRHVHFGLRQHSVYVGINNHNVGGWVPVAGGAYGGYALHGSRVVYPGGVLHNYGALGFNQGIIDANGGTVVNKRTGPGTNYGVAGSVTDGTTVTVSCSANGTTHAGRWGSTSLWNRLTDGTWVTDAFMWTGVNGPVAGYC